MHGENCMFTSNCDMSMLSLKGSTRVNAISYDRLDITQSLGNSIQVLISCLAKGMLWRYAMGDLLQISISKSIATHRPTVHTNPFPTNLLPVFASVAIFYSLIGRNCHRGLLLPRTWWAALRRTRPPRVGGKTGGKTSAKLEGFVVHKTCLGTTRNLLLLSANYQKLWFTRHEWIVASSSLRIQYDISWLP